MSIVSAVEVERAMAERNAGASPDRRLEFRIGINLGDVIVEGDDIHGDGRPDELPRIKNKRAYLEGFTVLPDWRITCFFVDQKCRGKGVASAALKGALRDIALLGEETRMHDC